MKYYLLVLFFCCSVFCEDAATAHSDVIVLNTEAFADKTKTGDWLVKFYAPWCGHCKRLAPTWDELATKSKDKFNVAKVDCTVEKDLCTQYGIRGYPTVKLFRDGAVHDYNGQRTIDDFTSFVLGGPKIPEIKHEEAKKEEPKKEEPKKEEQKKDDIVSDVIILEDSNFNEKVQEGDWLVKFYAPWCGHCKKLAPTWDELATKAKGRYNVAKIDCTVHKEACNTEGVRGYPTLKFFSNGKKFDYKGARTIDDFESFVEKSKTTREEL